MTPRVRGHLGLYALAFFLLLASASILAVSGAGLFESTRLLWASIGCSLLAATAAVASVAVPRR